MKVLKFGGTSVANAQNINKVIEIIRQSLNNQDDLVIVVSALGGVTDGLIKLTTLASKQEGEYKVLFETLCQKHNQVVKELIKPADQEKVLAEVNKKYDELKEIVENTKELPARSLDLVMSFGELLSSYIISEAIKSRDIGCEFVDARTLIRTDDNFGEGNVDIKTSYKLISKYLKNKKQLFVMGGFIGSTKDGLTTTLGRGGSDYTASLVGAALDASAIEIWTDVDGIMTADPNKVASAVLIPEISYEEAERMALSGAKVIHPKTMQPARLKNIPIYIKNTFNPKRNGTKIKK